MYSSFNFFILPSSPTGSWDWWGMGGTLSQYYWVFVLGGAHDLCILSDLTKDYIAKKITPVLRRNLWSWGMKACKNSVLPGLDPWHLCDTGRALYPINRWSPLQFVSTSRSSNRSYSYIYYLIEVYATGIFFLSFLVLQYVQNMYLKFKLVNYIAKPMFLSSKLANLPSRMPALSRGQNDKYDVQRFGVT